MLNPELDKAILDILKHQSLSEFDLIKTLQAEPYSLFSSEVFTSELGLFQTHFILHNALYRLRDLGLASGQYDIETLTTQLAILPLTASERHSVATETRPEVAKLRAYYLDWQHFQNTQEQDVLALLDNFWQSFSRRSVTHSEQQVEQALAAMSFDAKPTLTELKRRYKELSIQHHPDKGGDAETFSRLQQNYELLKLALYQS